MSPIRRSVVFTDRPVVGWLGAGDFVRFLAGRTRRSGSASGRKLAHLGSTAGTRTAVENERWHPRRVATRLPVNGVRCPPTSSIPEALASIGG